MGVIALFPGQGSQAPGMGKEWFQDFPIAREIFESASEFLKLDFQKLCFEGPEAELLKTENTQPCLLLLSCLGFKILESELKFAPTAGAGHSLGEYSALVSAGALDFKDALRVVRRRGELMAEAGRDGSAGMLAVLGIGPEDAEGLCQEAGGGEVLVPANFNAPGQVVISGTNSALLRAQNFLKERKLRGIRLKVSGAFHSPMMESASQGVAQVLAEVNFHPFRFPVISNLEAKAYPDPESSREILVKQVVSPVRWLESVQHLLGMKPTAFIEIGPGKVLAGLMKKIAPEIPVYNFSNTGDLKELGSIFC